MTTLPQLQEGHFPRDTRFVVSKRITCDHNSRQRERLVATIIPGGISFWCDHCRLIYIYPAEKCMEFWEAHDHEINKHPLLLRRAPALWTPEGTGLLGSS